MNNTTKFSSEIAPNPHIPLDKETSEQTDAVPLIYGALYAIRNALNNGRRYPGMPYFAISAHRPGTAVYMALRTPETAAPDALRPASTKALPHIDSRLSQGTVWQRNTCVLCVDWDAYGRYKILTFERGDWEREVPYAATNVQGGSNG